MKTLKRINLSRMEDSGNWKISYQGGAFEFPENDMLPLLSTMDASDPVSTPKENKGMTAKQLAQSVLDDTEGFDHFYAWSDKVASAVQNMRMAKKKEEGIDISRLTGNLLETISILERNQVFEQRLFPTDAIREGVASLDLFRERTQTSVDALKKIKVALEGLASQTVFFGQEGEKIRETIDALSKFLYSL